MINKFNDLSTKSWMTFQRSFFMYKSSSQLYKENIQFFTKKNNSDGRISNVLYKGSQETCREIKTLAKELGRDSVDFSFIDPVTRVDFAIFDERENLAAIETIGQYEKYREKLYQQMMSISRKIGRRRFLLIIAQNIDVDRTFIPAAWDIGKMVSDYLSLKDEKIACIETLGGRSKMSQGHFRTDDSVFYCLYFRHDEQSSANREVSKTKFKFGNEFKLEMGLFDDPFPSWQLTKMPEDKQDMLHPDRFSEVKVGEFIEHFTRIGENVFDPMSGTGATQVAAIAAGRNAYGTELSLNYTKIAQRRAQEVYRNSNARLYAGTAREVRFEIKHMDARFISREHFPTFDYIITSPPYWDQFTVTGAKEQIKSKLLGINSNPKSDSKNDLANIKDYDEFMRELTTIYRSLIKMLKPGGFMTVIIENVKKGGKNYPFAWDLAANMSRFMVVCQESFLCYEDKKILPYGLGNTWVSNTMHSYCLTFRKPVY